LKSLFLPQLARLVLKSRHEAAATDRRRQEFRDMTADQPSLIARDHTLLGVCEALGEDFGFNPVYLRIVFAVSLIWNAEIVVGAYLALGIIVLVSRLIAPNRGSAPAVEARAAEPAGDNDENREHRLAA
jgi:phage shock protein C